MFLPLFALELRHAPLEAPRPRLGWALLGLALLAELLLVAGGLPRVARPAIALAAVGMGFLQGRPALRASALLLAFVPIPTGLVSLASPALETLWGEASIGLLQLAGKSVLLELGPPGETLQLAHGSLLLVETDGGMPAAALAAGLAWWGGLRRGAPIARTLLAALCCASLAAPVQILSIAAAAAWVDGGGMARPALDMVPWLIVLAVGLPLAARGRRARA